MSSSSTDSIHSFRFPAEWEPQDAVWFAWPTRQDLWKGVLTDVLQQLAELYIVCARFQTVRVLCPSMAQSDLRRRLDQIGDSSRVEFYDYTTDDVWIRDYGPLFLLGPEGTELAIADFAYNAWGNKFPLQERDNAASRWIARQLGIPRYDFDYIVEGGAIESNGAGGILSTEVVLLNPSRNAETTKPAVAAQLQKCLNVDTIYWLKDGLEGDDTDGHIDNLARFSPGNTLLIAEAPSTDDSNFGSLSENIRRAKVFTNKMGKPFNLVYVPLPKPLYSGGERLAASYLNYLVLNDAVIVPTYGQGDLDQRAMSLIGACFPERKVVGFDCLKIIEEGGALHCMSQHQPAVSGRF